MLFVCIVKNTYRMVRRCLWQRHQRLVQMRTQTPDRAQESTWALPTAVPVNISWDVGVVIQANSWHVWLPEPRTWTPSRSVRDEQHEYYLYVSTWLSPDCQLLYANLINFQSGHIEEMLLWYRITRGFSCSVIKGFEFLISKDREVLQHLLWSESHLSGLIWNQVWSKVEIWTVFYMYFIE